MNDDRKVLSDISDSWGKRTDEEKYWKRKETLSRKCKPAFSVKKLDVLYLKKKTEYE